MRLLRLVGAVAVLIGMTLASLLVPPSALPREKDRENLAPSRDAVALLRSRCMVCHSTDLIVQQRLDRARWTAVLHKMVAWGAVLSGPEQRVLLKYLAARYHPDAPAEPPAVSEQEPTPVGLPLPKDYPAGRAKRGAGLFASHCLPCHGSQAEGAVGPRLAGNPVLEKNDRFWNTVLHGRGAMPPWKEVLTTQQIADLQAWLRTLQ